MGRFSGMGAMQTLEIVEVFPDSHFLLEVDIAFVLKRLIEFLIVDTRALELTI